MLLRLGRLARIQFRDCDWLIKVATWFPDLHRLRETFSVPFPAQSLGNLVPVPERLWAFAPNMPEKGKEASKKGKEPFTQQYEVKDVFPHFCDRKTKLLALQDVPYVLRAMGLTIYVDEEKGIREQLEKVDGMGKPVSLQTMQSWVEEHGKNYVKSYDDAYSAVGTLCHEGIIGDKSGRIQIKHLQHLVSEVGDKISVESFKKIMKGGDSAVAVGIKDESCSLDEFLTFLQK